MPPEAHAKLSSSGSAMWLNCPGSIKANDPFPDQTSEFAEEGTKAHELAEAVMSNGTDIEEYRGTWADSMVDPLSIYIDYVNSISGLTVLEQKVNLSEWVPEGFGTADAVIIKNGVCNVVDLKYGKGVQVFAKENTQLMLYALGVYSEWELVEDIDRFALHIVQPRLDHIDKWEISTDELLQWGEWVKERAALALSDDAPRIPGEKQCQWCRAKGICPELYEFSCKLIGADFDNLEDLENPDKLSKSKITKILDGKKLITSWLNAVEESAFNMAMENELPGWKIVEGRSIRKWANEQEAEKKLKDITDKDIWEKKLLSPTKAEKLLGKTKAKEIKDLIVKPEGKPALVPESDKRKPLNSEADIKSDFKAA